MFNTIDLFVDELSEVGGEIDEGDAVSEKNGVLDMGTGSRGRGEAQGVDPEGDSTIVENGKLTEFE